MKKPAPKKVKKLDAKKTLKLQDSQLRFITGGTYLVNNNAKYNGY